ncbi:MAG: hypothetical protein ACJ8AT_06675 [Hyalangium sp.]|uniref:hypothetical protein n=1 Tax=Hyalangium sp. TaxID=2028555 RepID=UPI00389AB739
MRALLVLGLFTAIGVAAAEPPARPTSRVWAVPKPLEVVDVPGRTEALGLPVSIHAVRSAEKVEALESHFRRQFQEAGLYLPPPGHVVPLTSEAQVTGLDPDTYIAYTVFFQPNPDGTTTVILTEAFLAERNRGQKDAFAPVMPGARAVLQTHTEGSSVLQYSVKASREAVLKFHAQTLGSAGYREVDPGVFKRGVDVLRVTTQPSEDGEVVVVVVKLQDVLGPRSSTPPSGGTGAAAEEPGQ